MKKIFSLVALLALCSLPMWAGNEKKESPWTPGEQYAKWCREFQLDKVWAFTDAGSANNAPNSPDDGTFTTYCPNMLSFSIMSWKDRPKPEDYMLTQLTLSLYNDALKENYVICNITFSGDYVEYGSNGGRLDPKIWDTKEKIFVNEGNALKITNSNDNKTFYVQKRMNSSYGGNWGAQFCYFVTEYSQSLYDFLMKSQKASGLDRVKVRIVCEWFNGVEKKTYDEQTTLSPSLSQGMTAPTVTATGWAKENEHTTLSYSMTSSNQEAKTVIKVRNTTTNAEKQIYDNDGIYAIGFVPVNILSQVTPKLIGDDHLILTAQSYRGYKISHTNWLQCAAPDSMTITSPVGQCDVPLFVQPENLRVDNDMSGVNVVRWSMPNPKRSMPDPDRSDFVVERSLFSNFSKISNQFSCPFEPGQKDYSWRDSYSERGKDSTTYYYRIHRKNAAVNEPSITCSYNAVTKLCCVVDAHVDNDKGCPKLIWELDKKGLWTANTTLELRYGNVTKKLSRDSSSTSLSLVPCEPTKITLVVMENGKDVNPYILNYTMPDTIPSAFHITVSKGYYNDRVKVDWKVPQDSANFNVFNAYRCDLRDVGTKDAKWSPVGSQVFTAGILNYGLEDNTCVPGVYYRYKVVGSSTCAGHEAEVYSESSIGFAQPYGVVTGQVHYNSNQGVEGVKISAVGSTKSKGRSLHLTSLDSSQVTMLVETGEYTHWSTYADTKAHYNKNAGTMEVWVKKMTNVQLPVFLHNDFRMYITPDNKFKIECKGDGVYKSKTDATVLNLSDTYHAVALTYSYHDKMVYCKVYLDGQYLFSYDESFNDWYYPAWATYMWFGSDVTDQDAQLDEIRMWDVELSASEIASRANRHLTDAEKQNEHLKYYDCRRALTREDQTWRTKPSSAEMSAANTHQLLGQQSGTMEMWLKPETTDKNKIVLSQQGNLDWRITAQNMMQVTFLDNTNLSLQADLTNSAKNWKEYKFNHVAVSYQVSGDTLLLQLFINGRIADSKMLTSTYSAYDTHSNYPLYLGKAGNENFDGYIDEIRFWSIYRDSVAINKTMDCYLNGTEYGLTAYYRCDDENTGEIYDISKTNSSFNGRHMKLNDAILDDNNIPTSEQLSLATRTDYNGNYILNAVPYNAGGSLYTLIPSMGTHVFSPSNTPIFFDKSASTHNTINFTDNSSFEVSGYVKYKNTNYPVEGCLFAVDGIPCARDNQIVQTDADGYYIISVPIGEHVITITKEGHTFADGGRYPKMEGEIETKYDFQAPINELDFTDLTLVTLTGRVAGGEVQETLPHGMQQGTNNIGQARVVISPVTKGKYDLNLLDSTRLWTIPDSCMVKSTAITGRPQTDAGRYVVITTDPQTGEFSVKLPPIDMSVDSISVPSNPLIAHSVSPASIPTLELSDLKASSQKTDSAQLEDGMHYFKYVQKLDVIHRVTPVLDVCDTTRSDGLFGIDNTTCYDNIHDTTYLVPLIRLNPTTNKHEYIYGCPFFLQNNTYYFRLKCYEKYTNADDPNNIKEEQVPVSNSQVSIYNGAGESLTGKNFVVTDANGEARYRFQAGDPNIMPSDSLTEQYHRYMSISYTDSKQSTTYNWDKNHIANCIVLGVVNIDGQNFITEGPDQVLYVLRDPPGSKSFATLKKGTTFTVTESTTTTRDNSGGGDITVMMGPTLKTGAGFGLMFINTFENMNEDHLLLEGGTTKAQKSVSAITATLSREISTSTDEWLDGPSGDVFIGVSSNFNYGDVKCLSFNYMADIDSIVLGVTEKTGVSKEYKTDFALTQYQIEGTQLPNMRKQRNALIDVVDTATYRHYREKVKQSETEVKYISEIPKSDPHFGLEGYYIAIPPTKRVASDQVAFYNAQIDNWTHILSENEKTKVNAIEQRKYKRHHNITIDGGAAFTENAENDTVSTADNIATSHFHMKISLKLGYAWNNIGLAGEPFYEHSWQKETEVSKDEGKSTGVSYTFDLSVNSQLSVDVYEGADAFGPIFSTSAGLTECPYEGEEKTKFFEPGKHILSTATQKLCDPEISIDNATVNGVPVGGKAIYTMRLWNKSNATNYTTMRLKQHSGKNPYGAEIKVDGSPLTEAGIPMVINPNTEIVKTLTLSQSDLSRLKYENIGIIWCSDCSPVKTADTTYISASFVAECPDVQMSLQKTIVNVQDKALSIAVSGYDVNSPTLQKVRLEYKQANDPVFRYQIAEFDLNTLKQNPQMISYQWDMSALLDGVYDVRAVAVCNIGGQEIIGEGNYFTITKDTSAPVALGLPSPVNGIYTNDDEIYVLMNEPIQTAKVMPANVSVTGMLNAHDVSQHDVAFHYTDQVSGYTESQVYVSSKAFSLEMWMRYQKPGTVFYHGKKDGLWVYINEAGYLEVGMPTDSVVSKIQVPKDTWCFLLMTMQNATDSTCQVSLHLAYNDKDLKDDFILPTYAKTAPILVGYDGEGDVHEMMMTATARTWEIASIERNQSKDLYTDAIGYWPMNEGYGQVAKDQLRHRNLVLSGESWCLNGENYAKHVNKPLTVPVNTATVNNDYAIEMWLRQYGDGEIFRTSDTTMSLGSMAGQLVMTIGSDTIKQTAKTNLSDGGWHQLTFLGNKSGKAVCIVDGSRMEFANAALLPNLLTKALVFGATDSLDLDELRVWKSDMSESWLELNRYCQLGADAMTKYEGRLSIYQSMNDVAEAERAMSAAPLRQPRLQSKVNHTITTSDEVLLINITEPAYRIEGCTLEFCVSGLIDANGNYSSPITWTAYVNRNQLLWSEREVNVTKENLAAATFKVDIVNNSGKQENWQLSNIPEWLTFSETSGTIQPLSEYHLMATIDPSLAIGTYEPVIYLTGSQSIKAPLYLNVKVTGDEPDWQINTADFEYTMNMIAVATLNGFAIDDEEDKVAAFVNGQLAGVASPKYNKTYYQFFVMMDIYANLTQEQKDSLNSGQSISLPVSFKLWDASTGIVYTQLQTLINGVNTRIDFTPNSIVGSVASPVVLTAGSKVEQTIPLDKGWNWISFNVLDEKTTLNDFLRTFISDVTIIKSQTEYALVDSMRQKMKGSLAAVDAIKSYHLNSDRDASKTIVGYPVNPMIAGIKLGANRWTWIGYIPQMSLSVNAAMANLTPTVGDVVKGRKGFATWDGSQWIGSLAAMVPGQGYMYYNASATAQTLYYPTNLAIADYAPIRRLTSYSEAVFTPVDPGQYQNNMTITARVMDGDEVVTDAEVGVFADEECRANAFANEGLYFLTIPGEQSVSLTFKVVRGAEIITPEQGITYMTDAVVGDLYAPYIIQIGEASGLKATSDGLQATGVQKVLINEHVYIIRNGKKTNILGYEQ